MLQIFIGSTDVTDNHLLGSVSFVENLNNRTNVLNFTLDSASVSTGQSAYLYEVCSLRKESASGTDVLYVDDTYEWEQKFKTGDVIIMAPRQGDQEKGTILSIDHDNRTITLSANLSNTHTAHTKVGRLIFAGVIERAPEQELNRNGEISHQVSVTDRSRRLDRKNIVGTYENQYTREIISRMIYNFAAPDTKLDLETFESGSRTESGSGQSASAETTDYIQGSQSLSIYANTGTGAWTKTVSSTDISSYDYLRFWIKTATDEGAKMSSFKLRIGTDASNYYEFDIDNTGAENENCRWMYTVDLLLPDSTTGSPDLSAIVRIQIETTVSSNQSSGAILIDHIQATTGSFRVNDVERTNQQRDDVRIPYKKMTQVLNSLAKKLGMFRYVGYEMKLFFFSTNVEQARFDISNTSENYSKLQIDYDITQMKNRQVVRGGEAPGTVLFSEEFESDGVQDTWLLAYKPKTLSIYIDTGSGYGSAITPGVENLQDEASYDYVYNFQEKLVRRSQATQLNSGDKIKFEYYPYNKIRVVHNDVASQEAMMAITGGDGIFEGPVISDKTIVSYDEARELASSEVEAYSNAIVTITFDTEQDGLHPGQEIHITDTDGERNIDSDYLIQSISAKEKYKGRFIYKVTAGTTIYGLIEFYQMLLERTSDDALDDNELVDKVYGIGDAIQVADSVSTTQKSNIFYAMGASPGLTPNDAYADFSQTS